MEAALFQEATRRWIGTANNRGADERLGALVAAGDDDAFEILYQRYSAPIHRYLRRRLASEEEVQDVHQQVFLSAYSALRAGVEPVRFKSWLYRIAHNVCVSELRARKPVAVQLEDQPGLASLRDDAERGSREDLRELIDDLANIPKPQSSALLLREINDLSYAEIADTLHLPIATVRSQIFRARASLNALQAARDVDCSEIRAELSRLAGRRGRRSAHVANHLRVCTSCADYRLRLRQRSALSVLPLLPVAWLRPLRALFGSSDAASGVAAAGAGGVAVGAKVVAITASVVAVSVGVYSAPRDGSPASGDRGAVPFQDMAPGSPAGSAGPSAPALDRSGGADTQTGDDGAPAPLWGGPGYGDPDGRARGGAPGADATPPAQRSPLPVKPLDPPRTTQPPSPDAVQPAPGALAPERSGAAGADKPVERGAPAPAPVEQPPPPTTRTGSANGVGDSSGSGSEEDRAEREAEERAEEEQRAADDAADEAQDQAKEADKAAEDAPAAGTETSPAAESGTEPAPEPAPSGDTAGDASTASGGSPGA